MPRLTDAVRHTPTPLPGASRPTMEEQDMLLRLSTPQLNTLRYMVGRDIARYVAADRCPEYDGESPLLVLSDKLTLDEVNLYDEEGIRVNPDHIIRSADWDELSQLKDLREQLDNLWHGHTNGA